MKEKLIIKNFGPIKSVELDLGRFNILIGEQATGKSTVAKVLAVCRYFSYILEYKGNYINNEPIYFGIMAWGLSEFVQERSYIEYRNKDYQFIASNQKVLVQDSDIDNTVIEYKANHFTTQLLPLSNEFENLLKELEKVRIPSEISSWRIPTSFFLNDVKRVMDNPFYLPTQRGLQSIFDLGKNSIQNLSSALFNQLSKMDGIARLYKQETYIEPLDIYYVNRNGHGFIRKANETEFYSLYNAASGYQSIIPIVLTIKNYTENKKRNKTFLIEEIEQNLFPSAQNKLMQYVVEKTVNAGNGEALITTQSPYILTSLNNMMYAYQVGQVHPEKVSKQLDKKYWLNPNDVSAYLMKSDGFFENIIDDDGLIKAEKIDEVSKTINKEFNDIMDIELGVDEEAA